MQVAQETEHPRAYEVAGQLLKTNAENTEKLVNLQTTKKKLKEADQPQRVTNNNSLLYLKNMLSVSYGVHTCSA